MLTTNRFKHIKSLAAARMLIAKEPANADSIMRDAIIAALPPQYDKVFRFVKSHGGDVPSSMVSTAFRLAQNHSSSILNELWQFGLLTRVERIDESGKRYFYS